MSLPVVRYSGGDHARDEDVNADYQHLLGDLNTVYTKVVGPPRRIGRPPKKKKGTKARHIDDDDSNSPSSSPTSEGDDNNRAEKRHGQKDEEGSPEGLTEDAAPDEQTGASGQAGDLQSTSGDDQDSEGMGGALDDYLDQYFELQQVLGSDDQMGDNDLDNSGDRPHGDRREGGYVPLGARQQVPVAAPPVAAQVSGHVSAEPQRLMLQRQSRQDQKEEEEAGEDDQDVLDVLDGDLEWFEELPIGAPLPKVGAHNHFGQR
jgi:hypothetical protein